MTTESNPQGVSLDVLSQAILALSAVVNQSPQFDLDLCLQAYSKLQRAHETIVAFDAGMNAVEFAPDGDSYAFVMKCLGA